MFSRTNKLQFRQSYQNLFAWVNVSKIVKMFFDRNVFLETLNAVLITAPNIFLS